jgi:DNA polymerase III subunit beta
VKFICEKDNLLSAIQIVQKAVATKSTIPILGGIYIKAENGILELQSNDYETGIKCSIPVQVLTNGVTVLASKYFAEIIRKLPGETVEISSSDNTTITIKSGNARFNLVSLPHEEFPLVQTMNSTLTYEIPENLLKNMIRQTTFACSQDETRPVFTGVLFEIEENLLQLVATNTHRLSLRTGILRNSGMRSLKVIVPSKVLNELQKILSAESENNVKIAWHQNKLAFQFRDVYWETQLIDGQFPNYQQVIPKSFHTEVTMQTSALTDAVERASLLTRDGDYNVVKLEVREEHIAVTSNNPEVGAGYEESDAVIKGDLITIAFNARYILDVLKIIDAPEIYFSFTTPLTPAAIKAVGQEQYMYIITPVRTN